MAKSLIQKHYTRILTLWPHDALRPTVSFQKTLQHRIDNRLSLSPSASSSNPADNVIANEAQATVPTPKPFDEKGELEQVNALYSFLENRYSRKGYSVGAVARRLVEKLKVEGESEARLGWPKNWGLIFHVWQYPLSERILKPASSPSYYDELIKELDEAPNRSWFGRLVKRWKGFIRLS